MCQRPSCKEVRRALCPTVHGNVSNLAWRPLIGPCSFLNRTLTLTLTLALPHQTITAFDPRKTFQILPTLALPPRRSPCVPPRRSPCVPPRRSPCVPGRVPFTCEEICNAEVCGDDKGGHQKRAKGRTQGECTAKRGHREGHQEEA